ncbi:histone-lysine N-methyltransferase SETDB1-A [Aplochiton taeniatus]
MMEFNGDDIEITPAELRSWIQEEVDTSDLVIQKRMQLDKVQTLIERREKQAVATQNIYSCTYESVIECEGVMKQLYSQLGMVYRDTDSEEEDTVSQECFIDADYSEDDNTKAVNNADVNSSSSESTTTVTITQSTASKSSESGSPRSEIDEGSSAKNINIRKRPWGEGDVPLLQGTRREMVVLEKLCHYKLRVTPGQGTPKGQRKSDEVASSSDDSDWEPQSSSGTDSDSDYSESSCKAGAKSKKSRKAKGCPITSKKIEDSKKEHQQTKDMTSKPLSAGPLQSQEATKCGSAVPADTQDANKGESCTPVVSSLSLAALNPDTQPQVGLVEEDIQLDMVVLAKKKTRTWHQAKIVEIKTVECGFKYKVDFGENGQRWVSAHHIAFDHTPSLPRLYVGVRVVTKYQQANESWFSSGVLAELPNRKNRMRFLVFFDDGFPSYVGLPILHLVCRPLKNVLEDIEEEAHRDFIKDYLKVYPNPPMAQYRVGQTINTEFEGVQRRCEVEQIDSSLIELRFLNDKHKEWVYRGSMRLEHIANMKKHFEESKNKNDIPRAKITFGLNQKTVHSSKYPSNGTSTATTAAGSATTNSSNSGKNETTPASKVVTYTPHRCCPACIDHLQAKGDIKHRGRNPLMVPLLLEFRRIKGLQRIKGKVSFHVFYRAPCGLSLRTMGAVQEYLLQTCCDFVRLEMFSMDPFVSVTTTYQPLPSKVLIPDFSQGRENQPLSCINEHNSIRPPAVNYCRDRVITKGIFINANPEFLEGCDCTDGCRDSMACSCHQLTIQATSLCPGGPVDINAGYSHKRLEKRIPTGIYECNSLCRCNPRLCSNRMVQHGVQLRLQLFMTQSKGWGIRTLDDVAKGTFICTFAGRIMTNEKKNTSANEYYAKLNHIEGVEIFKDGYEKEAYCSDSETGGDTVEPIDEDGSSGDSSKKYNYKNQELSDSGENFNHNVFSLERSESAHKNTKVLQDATLLCKRPESAEPPVLTDVTDFVTRRFFEEEACYIIDAKLDGNLARYLNHSCFPNLFEQNVFVDTHDLRFPLIAFFARKHIRAGTELTWNYCSLIGSVNDERDSRVLRCRCGSMKCKGELLMQK